MVDHYSMMSRSLKIPSLYLGWPMRSAYCLSLYNLELTRLSNSDIMCHFQHYAHKSDYTNQTWQKIKISPLVRYIRALRWTPVPLGLGFAFIAYQQLRHVKKREATKIALITNPEELLASNFSVSLYTMLPLRATSRFWGWFHNMDLPYLLRKPVLNFYVSIYGCNMQEAVIEDLSQYKNLGEFFSRRLKKEVRPIHPGHCLVSPCDGVVLHFGIVENGHLEQIKGISYSLKSFLGISSSNNNEEDKISDEMYQNSLLHNKNNALYHCVIYLAPGDYHKFHSPVEWRVHHRRHFPGQLLSVCPGFVTWISGLFNINERAVYTGEWKHGFFSITAVGATNVGSINVFCDKSLHTNRKEWKKGSCDEQHFDPSVIQEKGELFGEFNLGSTVVLVFEAPKGIKFDVNVGQKIRYGELMTLCDPSAL